MSIKMAKPEHEVAYQVLCDLIRKHADKMDALELLAVAGNMVGKLIAMQDQSTVTAVVAMETVAKNIEHGNQQVVEGLAKWFVGQA